MDNNNKRILLFLFGCIPTRILIMLIAKTYTNLLQYMSLPAAIISIGFALIYIFKLRNTGPEVFGDRIWWNDLRPIHSILWALFAITAYQKLSYAWIFLLIDIIIGLTAFLYFHFYKKN